MKLIHCGDIHLESSMKKNLTLERARERKNELLLAFEGMVEYGAERGVQAVLICGDLFDTKNITKRTKTTVLEIIKRHSEMDFLYLAGNHDEEVITGELEEVPSNLKLFSHEWAGFRYGNVVITGMELDQENAATAGDTLVLNQNDVNIVMLHGQEAEYTGKDRAEVINLSTLRNKNIDYLALGHLHTYRYERLDARGNYCYCGCLEGRGFDECGEKGFVMLEIEDNHVHHEFVPFAKRRAELLEVDVTGCMSTGEAGERMEEALREVSRKSMIKVVLTGKVPPGAQRDTEYLTQKYAPDYYAFKVSDETRIEENIEDLMKDVSLKGEFIRLVMEREFTPEEKREIIETGIRALIGEEIDR